MLPRPHSPSLQTSRSRSKGLPLIRRVTHSRHPQNPPPSLSSTLECSDGAYQETAGARNHPDWSQPIPPEPSQPQRLSKIEAAAIKELQQSLRYEDLDKCEPPQSSYKPSLSADPAESRSLAAGLEFHTLNDMDVSLDLT